MSKTIKTLMLGAGLLCQGVVAQDQDYEKEIDALLQKMTLAEKVGQLNQYSWFFDATGPSPSEGDAKQKFEHLKNGYIGSVLNVSGTKEVREMQTIAVEQSRLGIPLIFAMDVIHGHKTLSPIPLAETASWNMELIEQSARVAAIEASAMGINWTFAPMVDISRDARWGRVMEGAGEDPYLGQKVAAARVKGFQGDDLSANDTILATAKHFAGYGFAEAGRDYNTVDVGGYTLHNVILPPFKAALDAGARTFMNGFNILNGEPATASEYLQREILKGQWQFDGLVVSDWASIAEMKEHGVADSLETAAKMAITAGSDVDMESYAYIKHLEKLVEQGQVSQAVVDDAVARVLRLKFELGLFEDPYKYIDERREQELLYHPEHKGAALALAKESIVLLKNKDAVLPLKKSQSNIAVIGALAEDKNSILGSWRLGSDDNSGVSLLEGLDALGVDYQYAKGADVIKGEAKFLDPLNDNTDDTSGFDKAIKLAKKSDVVVMMLGEHGFHSGEGRSRTRLGFPGVQQELLEKVYEVNPNIVLLVASGRPLVLDWADKHVPAIVQTWQLGTQSGHAIAATLFGDNNPSGKLPMSFPRHIGQVPLYYAQMNTGRPGPSEQTVWSHYIDERNDALYPFGYGLSYSDFAYQDLKITDAGEGKVAVSVTVTNTSSRTGSDVAQLYIHDKVASLSRPNKELKGFKKFELEANESTTVRFILTEKELGFYDNQGKFKVEAGEFDVMVGPDSINTLKASFDYQD